MAKTRIMIVEDEILIARQLSLKLERFGYEVVGITAYGEEAIREAVRATPDLVLMDIAIKGEMDGIEAATILQRDYGIPVIYVTAYADDSTLERAERSGAYGYVLKPFNEREIHAMVRLALSRHASTQNIVRTLRAASQSTASLRHTLDQVTLQFEGMDAPHLQTELRDALERDALEVYYQPCVAVGSGIIVGVEALMRWNHPRRGLLLPPRLLPLAEEGGFSSALDQWVFERACEQARGWMGLYPGLKLTMNLSPDNFRAGTLRPWLERILKRTGVDPASLQFDLTESAFLQDDRRLGELQLLKAMGSTIAVDDFGIGYSMLPKLPQLPVDAVKIHQSFVRRATAGERSASVMQALIQLVGAAGLTTIAKGVESNDELDLLREQGCDFLQGYLFSPAVKFDAIDQMLATQKQLAQPAPRAAPAQRDSLTLRQDDISVEQLELVEHLVEQRTRELRAANVELEAFAAAVAHDLRAPLRTIIGFSAILGDEAREQLDQNQNDILDRVLQAGSRMQEQIDALLGLSRLSRCELLVTDADLSAIATQILADRTRANPDQRIEANISPGLHALADPGLMLIVLQNLLDNALKYSGGKPVTRVWFERVETSRGTAFCVADNGVGFDPAQADRLFKPFQRLHTQKEFPGTGIGLVSIQRIVSRHGGEVWAESIPGEGSRFFFTLPG